MNSEELKLISDIVEQNSQILNALFKNEAIAEENSDGHSARIDPDIVYKNENAVKEQVDMDTLASLLSTMAPNYSHVLGCSVRKDTPKSEHAQLRIMIAPECGITDVRKRTLLLLMTCDTNGLTLFNAMINLSFGVRHDIQVPPCPIDATDYILEDCMVDGGYFACTAVLTFRKKEEDR